jgi:hypothetical protein|tara:strand:+ start:316 stop:501 length:186 start_codon:yes stop_codon:yes gene_type:complete
MSFGKPWAVTPRQESLLKKGEIMKGKLLQPDLDLYDPSKPIEDLWKYLALWGHHAYIVQRG